MVQILKQLTIGILIAVLFSACDFHHTDTTHETEVFIETAFDETLTSSEEIDEKEIAITEESIPALDIAAGDYKETFADSTTGDYLDYYLFVPENAVEGMPLIVFLHGDGEVGNIDALQNFGMIAKAKEIYGNAFPFLAISPCTRVTSWISGTIPETLKALIDQTVEAYAIDPEHIIITGHSRGAIGTWYMINEYGGFFSAAVPVSCGVGSEMNMDNCVSVPVWAFAGNVGADENKYRLAMQSAVTRIQDAGGQAKLTVLEGSSHGQTSGTTYTAEVFQWMLEQ